MSSSEAIPIDPAAIAEEVLRRMLGLMDLECEVAKKDEGERVLLEVSGADTGLVIGKKGQTLDALQHLVNKIVARRLPEGTTGKAIHLDAEGYRDRRAETLVELAHRLAEKARRTGRPVEAEPMSAAERRVIHVALSEIEGITTHSEGEGIHRHLVVVPTSSEP
jgi:spoIIIJ-associated protein